MSYSQLKHGDTLKVESSCYLYSNKDADISELVTKSADEIDEMEKASIAAEQAIYDKMLPLADEWQKQAEKTVLCRWARDYQKTKVEHSANKAVNDEYGRQSISNMVYKMTWQIWANTEYDRAAKRTVPSSYTASWSLRYNSPKGVDYANYSQIAGQDKKVYKSVEEAQKYIEGRLAAYAHCFSSVSPPLPPEARSRFSVHGCLLPGYTVAEKEKSPQEVAAELAEFLDEPPQTSAKKKAAEKKTTYKKPKQRAMSR